MSRSRIRILSAALPLLVMVSLSPALAADPPAAAPAAPPDTTRFVLAPSITLSDVGLDTKILTTARDQKRDATGNIKLELEPSLPFGRARLSGKLAARGAWFREYTEQRSLDSDDSMKLEVRINRLTAHASGSYLHAHDRFDPEIFVRTLRTETAIEAGSDFNVSRRTNLGVALQQSSVAFEVTTVALDARLREALNRNTSSLATWMRSALTPLTTVAVIVDTEREHFDFMPERDATSVKAVGGLEFKPAALVDCKVFAGYRAFSSVGDDDSNGRGFAGSLDLGYTLASRVLALLRVHAPEQHRDRPDRELGNPRRCGQRVARLRQGRCGGGAGDSRGRSGVVRHRRRARQDVPLRRRRDLPAAARHQHRARRQLLPFPHRRNEP